MKADKDRYEKKIKTYTSAVYRAGLQKVEDVIGIVAASKFEMANDAFNRGQHCVIIADFLEGAQCHGEEFSGHDCIYEALESIN